MKEKQRATIRDVALEAGVGTTTVSRVINGGKLVAPAVRMRVESVIRQLGFEPSHAARSLASRAPAGVGDLRCLPAKLFVFAQRARQGATRVAQKRSARRIQMA